MSTRENRIGQHAFVLGRSVERAVRLVSEQIDFPETRVIAVFDGVDMYVIDWDE